MKNMERTRTARSPALDTYIIPELGKHYKFIFSRGLKSKRTRRKLSEGKDSVKGKPSGFSFRVQSEQFSELFQSSENWLMQAKKFFAPSLKSVTQTEACVTDFFLLPGLFRRNLCF